MHAPLQGIAELPSDARLADKLLTVQEQQELMGTSQNPSALFLTREA